MYSRYILLSALLVIGAETYAKNNKTEVVSLSSSYNNSVENNSVDSSSQDSIFKDETLHEVKVVARKSGTSRLAGAVNGIAVNKDELFKAACCNLGESFTTNPGHTGEQALHESGAGKTVAYGLYPTLGFRCSTSVCRHRASPLADVASSCYL
jgi:hypothetical protein